MYYEVEPPSHEGGSLAAADGAGAEIVPNPHQVEPPSNVMPLPDICHLVVESVKR